jgi:uncharacterized repeat protein (TIGR01451 family)
MSPVSLRHFVLPCALLGVVAAGAAGPGAAGAATAATHVTLTKSVRGTTAASPALIFRLVATNRGARAARSVKVRDVLPAATRLVSASRGCSSTGRTVTCALGTIPGGGQVVITIVVKPIKPPSGVSLALPGLLAGLSGGSTTLTSPDSTPSVVTAPVLLPTCTRTVTGTVDAPIIVHSGETVCIVDATVRASVIVDPGGGLSVIDSSILGALSARSPTFVSLCGPASSPYVPAVVTVAGAVSIAGATGPVTIGSLPGGGCSPNQLRAALILRSNAGTTTVVGNTIGGGVSARSNAGGLLIAANSIGGSLACAANVPPPTNGGSANTVVGTETGQCSGL